MLALLRHLGKCTSFCLVDNTSQSMLHTYMMIININMMIIIIIMMLTMTIFVMMVIMLLKMMYGINKRALVVKSRIWNLLNLCQINFSSGNLSTISKCEKLAFLDATPNYTFKLNFLHRAHICQQLSTFLCIFHQIEIWIFRDVILFYFSQISLLHMQFCNFYQILTLAPKYLEPIADPDINSNNVFFIRFFSHALFSFFRIIGVCSPN